MKGNKEMKKLFMLVALVLFGMGILTGCGSRESVLEESAKPLVSKLIVTQLGGSAKCLKVTISEKVDDKHYKANAALDNGNDLRIMIEDRGDQIYVTIPVQ